MMPLRLRTYIVSMACAIWASVPVSAQRASSTQAAPLVLAATSYDWSRQRVGGDYEGSVALKNIGAANVEGLSLRFEGDTNDFRMDIPAFSGTVLAPGDSLVLDLRFRPTATGQRQMKIIYEWAPGGEVEVASTVRGVGTKPELIAPDCDFGAMTIGDPAGMKKIYFLAPDVETLDSVTITGLRFESDSAGGEADFRYELLGGLNFPIVLKGGESIEAAVYFQPRAAGVRHGTLTALTLDSADLTSYWKGTGMEPVASISYDRERAAAQVHLLPNPAAGAAALLRYTVSAPGPVRIDLLDPRGAELRTFSDAFSAATAFGAGEQQQVLDISAIPSGAYFVRLRFSDRTIIKPLVITR